MKIFNPLPGHIAPSSIEIVPAPVGQRCDWCDELIGESDSGLLIPYYGDEVAEIPFHKECFLRQIVGSVAHQLGECSCAGGDREDPPGISKREAAKMASDLLNGRI